MNALRCLPFRHSWQMRAVQKIRQTRLFHSTGREVTTGYETEVLYACTRCGRFKVKTLPGGWEADSLTPKGAS